MTKIIISEEQSKRLARAINEEVYQMPQNIGDHENKPYSINPEKVKIVRNYLDGNFKKGNFDDIGPDGFPRRTRIVAMLSNNGEVLKNMRQEELLDLLIERFKNMFLDKVERELFLKQVMKDWFDNKIGVFGNLSVNGLISENVENEVHGATDDSLRGLEDEIFAAIKKKFNGGQLKVIIPQNVIETYYPYNNPPSFIRLLSDDTLTDENAVYERPNTIVFNPTFLETTPDILLKSQIAHELTHIINDNEGNIDDIGLSGSNDIDDMIYLFRPTEMSARISEFNRLISGVQKVYPLEKYNRMTMLKQMKYFLDKAESDPVFRSKVLKHTRNNKLGKMMSYGQFKQLYDKYRQRIYKIYNDATDRIVRLNESKMDEINDKCIDINTKPTEGQFEAGNYKKGHISVKGMKIAIENPIGSKRYYGEKDEDGNRKYNVMKNHYGYFNITKGKDGDYVDCFLGPHIDDFEHVFAIDQKNAEGNFDETKIMLGFKSKEQAKMAYLSNYEKGWDGIMSITEVPLKTFKKWLYRGRKQRQPFAEYIYIQHHKI